MVGENQLLRLLDPTVRPGSTPGIPGPGAPSRQLPKAPLEQRSFDELLKDAELRALAEPQPVVVDPTANDGKSLTEANAKTEPIDPIGLVPDPNQGVRPLKISGHAQKRLDEEGVKFDDSQMENIGRAVDEAEAKGAKDALMLVRQLGLIVNIPNRTVITALSADRMSSGVVTQIDSAIMVNDDL